MFVSVSVTRCCWVKTILWFSQDYSPGILVFCCQSYGKLRSCFNMWLVNCTRKSLYGVRSKHTISAILSGTILNDLEWPVTYFKHILFFKRLFSPKQRNFGGFVCVYYILWMLWLSTMKIFITALQSDDLAHSSVVYRIETAIKFTFNFNVTKCEHY